MNILNGQVTWKPQDHEARGIEKLREKKVYHLMPYPSPILFHLCLLFRSLEVFQIAEGPQFE